MAFARADKDRFTRSGHEWDLPRTRREARPRAPEGTRRLVWQCQPPSSLPDPAC